MDNSCVWVIGQNNSASRLAPAGIWAMVEPCEDAARWHVCIDRGADDVDSYMQVDDNGRLLVNYAQLPSFATVSTEEGAYLLVRRITEALASGRTLIDIPTLLTTEATGVAGRKIE